MASNILANTKVPKHFKKLELYFIHDLLYDFGIKNNTNKLLKVKNGQIGGTKEKTVKYIDIGGVYTFNINTEYLEDDDTIRIIVTTPDDNNCVTILIETSQKKAILHNVSYYENCAKEGLKKPGAGNKLLRFALNLIINSTYGINKILLKDNSYNNCDNCSETIKLARLRSITHGQPWYSNYGFRPYNQEKDKPDKYLIKRLEQNSDIISTLKTKDIDIIRIIEKAIRKEKLKNINIDKIHKLVNKYSSMSKFISRLMEEHIKYCCIVRHIVDYMFRTENELQLMDFFGKIFYLDI